MQELKFMNRTERILYIFLKLINGKTITVQEFVEQTGKGAKTLQRDVKDMNLFFYESDEWHATNTQIKHKRGSESTYYYLDNYTFTYDSYAVLGVLLQIKSLTPYLHTNVIKLFEKLKQGSRIEDANTIQDVINHFKPREGEVLPGKQLMTIQTAIREGVLIDVTFTDQSKSTIVPHSLIYMNYNYWLTYEENDSLKSVDVRKIDQVEFTDLQFKQCYARDVVTLEVHKDIKSSLCEIYTVIDERPSSHNDYLIIDLAVTELDAYYIAYQHTPHVRILGPAKYINGFLDRMKDIIAHYER